MDVFKELVYFILSLDNDSQLVLAVGVIVVLLFIVVGLYITYIGGKVHDIKKKYFAIIMDFIDDRLYIIYNQSYRIIKEVAKGRWDKKQCSNGYQQCKFITDTLTYQLRIAKDMLQRVILISTRDRMKTALHRNGFYSMKGAELDRYKTLMSKRFLMKNRTILEENGFNTFDLISMTDELRFNEENARKHFSDIVDEEIRLKALERKEILKAWLSPLYFWKWFKKEVL